MKATVHNRTFLFPRNVLILKRRLKKSQILFPSFFCIMVEYAYLSVGAKYYTDLSNRGVTVNHVGLNMVSREPYLGA